MIGRFSRRMFGSACCLLLGASTVGAVAAAPEQADVRKKLVLDAEPVGALSLTAAKEKLTTTPQPVVIAGRIGAKGIDPFLEGKASFSLVEIPAADHASKPGHDDDNCPFCRKRAANSPIAAVQFLGADGKPIPLDARKLFGVAKGSDVVIRGTAIFDPKLGIPVLQVTADAIHVRKPAK